MPKGLAYAVVTSLGPLESRDVLLRGVRVRYLHGGAGPALVLLHGHLATSRAWLAAAAGLADHFRVVIPDLPGAGASEKPGAFRYDREGLTEAVCDLLAVLRIARAHVAGHAFGGAVALTLAADYPDRVDRLAVLDTLAYRAHPSSADRLSLAPVVGPFAFRRLSLRRVFHAHVRDHRYAPGFAYDRAAVDAYFEAFITPDGFDAAYRLLPATLDTSSLAPKLPKVTAPTLVIWGESDLAAPLVYGRRLARDLANARLESVAGAGHAVMEENPARTVELLVRHFRATATAASSRTSQ